MIIYLTGFTALLLLRSSRADGLPHLVKVCDAPLPDTPGREMACVLPQLAKTGCLGQTPQSEWDVLVSSSKHRTRGTNVRSTMLSQAIPDDSFLELELPPGALQNTGLPADLRVFIDSPELSLLNSAAFLQRRINDGSLDQQVAFARLFGLTCEFFGSYGRPPLRPMDGEVIYGLEPLSSNRRLTSYLEQCGGARGVQLARSVSQHGVDMIASPLEALVYALLELPPRRGGIGFPKLLANARLDLSEAGTEHHVLTPDLWSPELGLAIECDGRSVHAEGDSFVEDRRRIRDYQNLGLRVLPVTYNEVRNLTASEGMLRQTIDIVSDRLSPQMRWRLKGYVDDEGVRAKRALLLAGLLPAYRQ